MRVLMLIVKIKVQQHIKGFIGSAFQLGGSIRKIGASRRRQQLTAS